MQILTIGKRMIPTDHVAYVEAFDPANNLEFKPGREFRGRIVLLNRDTVLTEMTPEEFAATHHMRLLAADSVAFGQRIAFSVEIFTPTESFQPSKPYRTRIKWRDLDGNEQSKLLLSDPEEVITELSRRGTVDAASSDASPARPAQRRRSRKTAPARG